MAQKKTETEEDMPIEEAEAIKPDFTGLPIEVHIRRHFQFIVILSICLFLGYLVFALTLLAWVTAVRWADNEGHLVKYNLELVWGRSFIMWRTDWGKDFIEKLAYYRTFWKRVGDVWVVTVFLIMIFMFLLLLWQATLAWQIPKSASVSPKMMIGLPGLNPVIPLWYGILALGIAMVIHEFSHGILSRVADVKVKALGLLLFVFPVGAFVEPDEEGMKSMKRWERMRLYAAGPGSNMVVAIICSIMFSWVMVSSLEPSNEGVLSASVVVDYGGEKAGLEPWMLITAIDEQEVTSADDFSEALNETYVGQVVNVSVLDKGNPDTYQVTLSDKGSYYLKYYPDSYEPWMSGKGFMGIAVVDPDAITENLAHPANSGGSMLQYITLPFQDLQPFPEHFTALFEPTGIVGILPDNIFWILANCFYWIFWLNLMVGLTNALPAVPLDGGFIFADGVTGILDKVKKSWSEEKKEAIVDKLVGILAFSVLFLVFWQLIGPKLVGVDPVILDANIDASGNEGFNGDVFTFDASGSDGDFVSYEWEFGDGNSATGESVSYNWSEGGVYFVVLTAKDSEDRQSVEFYQVTIDYTGEGSGEVGGGEDDTVAATINPYVNKITISGNVTGDNGLPLVASDVTVTITGPSGTEFTETYSLNNGQRQPFTFSIDAGEMVGDWEIVLESNDAASDFTYEYDWFNYFQASN
jgi:membrane-associated protease RseP (regulator of RpoE activity)|tara:strand:+ start:10 stop:2094 length:2085 start_codon:yes stop_codon:yes gene_type:complete